MTTAFAEGPGLFPAHESSSCRDGDVAFVITSQRDRPASLGVSGSTFAGRESVPLVEIFTAVEQRARTSQAYFRSAVGERLRVQSHRREVDEKTTVDVVVQRDDVTGLEVTTTLTQPHGCGTVRVVSRVVNTSTTAHVLTAVTSATIGFAQSEADLDSVMLATAASEWLAENRWRERRLRDEVPALSLGIHGQEGRGHFALSSHGAWPTGEHLPVGVLTSARTREAVAWQIEAGTAWHVDISQTRTGGVLSLLGPTDLEHQFASELQPGESFDAAAVAIAVSDGGRDGAFTALTQYRRWLRSNRPDNGLPLVYNDFMNTLMGQPSTEQLLPLIDTAGDAGAEVFCIDAGWFAEPAQGDWWATVGEWNDASSRFTSGLREVTQAIQDKGMRVGLWLEPEVVGADSPAAQDLPDEAFFQRFGRRVMEHRRYHLDFRHPAARAHLDRTVDRLVREHKVSFIKLDYNINPGAGTEIDATSAAAGLLGHVRALRDWLIDIQQRHPGLTIENCSSGAMRADYLLLEVTDLQSTSDQQDFRFYPPIAAAAPASILPEQAGNWAYPAEAMTLSETAFTLVTALSGRFYLSGFLHHLRPDQLRLVGDAVHLHKDIREQLRHATPFWPLGLPAWDDDTICLAYRISDVEDLVFVWDRSEHAADITLPGSTGEIRKLFPTVDEWSWTTKEGGVTLHAGEGLKACVLSIRRDG